MFVEKTDTRFLIIIYFYMYNLMKKVVFSPCNLLIINIKKNYG